MTSGSPDRASRRSSVAVAAVLAAVVAAIYLPALSHGFLNWDDDRLLLDNPAVTSADGLRRIWSAIELPDGFPNYPLVFTSYWIEHRLWGRNPLGFHAVNITLHALNACLVFFALLSLGFSRRAAAVAAGLFGLHPVQVESVAWIAERKNVLSATFYWASFVAYLRGRDPAEKRSYWVSLALFAAALLSKTATVVLPLSLLLADRVRDRRWTAASTARVAPMLVLAALAALQTVATESRSVDIPLAERPLLAGKALWFYALELLAPIRLLPIHPRWELRVDDATAWLPLVGVALVALTVLRSGTDRRVQWGLGHFACTLLPVLGLVPYGFQEFSFVADRNLYIACVGPFALLGAGVDALARRVRPLLADALAASILVSLALLTLRQIPVWRDSVRLWSHVVEQNPQAYVAHSNLGLALIERGRLEEAMQHLRAALELKRDYPEAHNNLALALYRSRAYEEAEQHCRAAFELSPDPQYAKNLGLALQAQRKGAAAESEFRRAVSLRPGDPGLRLLLANALLEQERFAEAISEYEAGLRIAPDSVALRNQLGRALLGRRRADPSMRP